MGRVSDKLEESKTNGRPCWLMKSEPDVYSLDDLKNDKTALWDGVRNFQARNMMRNEMQVGDHVLFYHSNAKPPGVAGLATVSGLAVADPEQFNAKSKYFDPTSRKERPKWYCVEVRYASHFSHFVPLAELKSTLGLENMLVGQRGMRLSVQPVTPAEFEIVCSLGKS